MNKKVIDASRIRQISSGFSFIPHQFLLEGFLQSLEYQEILLYFFLILAGDRYGLSYYSDRSICSHLHLDSSEIEEAREGLIARDLIAYDGKVFQVLSLPPFPLSKTVEQERAWQEDQLRALGKEG